jgi:hypothetical protein
MSKSVVIGLAAVVLIAASVSGGSIAEALQASDPAPRAAATAPKAGEPGTALTPACGLRKVWVATSSGPRLKWRRPCTDL